MSILNLLGMPRPPLPPHAEPAFVSKQVSELRRYYLDLNPATHVDLAVVCGGCERMRSDYLVERTTFPYQCIELVVEGAGNITLNGKRQRLSPGMIFAYGPGIAHTIRTDPRHPMRKYYLDFVGSQAAALIAATPLGSGGAVRVAEPMELVDIFEAIDREARGDDEVMARELCATYLRLLLLKIRSSALEHRGDVPRAYHTYLSIRRHIEEHYGRLHTVEAVAADMHVTPMHVARLFTRFGRTGAYRFILRLRMNRAAELLIDDGLLVKDVADKLGFPDAFTFSRAFKRIHGVPPSAVGNR